jgi:multidrug efflux pump subunit AcrB
MRDVAYVHDSAPPQTNVVQLEGKKGVLLTVLKAGSVSTINRASNIIPYHTVCTAQ